VFGEGMRIGLLAGAASPGGRGDGGTPHWRIGRFGNTSSTRRAAADVRWPGAKRGTCICERNALICAAKPRSAAQASPSWPDAGYPR
jgi:hypothetical protein